MFGLTKKHYYVLIFLILSIIILGYRFIYPMNYEFLIYIFVIIILFMLILSTNKKVNYPISVLWLLAFWAFFHMVGGAVRIDGHVLYEQMIFTFVNSGEWKILRYDQVIHAYGFFTATILSYFILKNNLKNPKIGFGLGLILVMAGCGFGAFNELIEFVVDSALPESGVGGYVNTGLDLVSNFVGSLLAIIFIKIFYEKKTKI